VRVEGRIGVLYRLKPETWSWCFLKLVLENKRFGVLYRLEPDLQGVGASSSWCLETGDWCLLELVLKRREIGVFYKL
jgi:hypothetical protein